MILLLIAVLIGGAANRVYAAARSGIREQWRYVYSIENISELKTPTGRSFSILKDHRTNLVYDVFPSRAVVTKVVDVNVIFHDANVNANSLIVLKVIAVNNNDETERVLANVFFTEGTLQTGTWIPIISEEEEVLSSNETLVVLLADDKGLDLRIGYEVNVDSFDPIPEFLEVFLPMILK